MRMLEYGVGARLTVVVQDRLAACAKNHSATVGVIKERLKGPVSLAYRQRCRSRP